VSKINAICRYWHFGFTNLDLVDGLEWAFLRQLGYGEAWYDELMLPNLHLGLIVGAPIVAALLLRSNAAVVFLAACAGVVLQDFLGPDAHMILEAALPRSGPLYGQILDFGLVLLPLLVTLIMLRKKSKGFKLVLGLVPIVCTGLLMAVVVIDFVSPISRGRITDTIIWKNISEFRGPIVGLGVVSSLALLKPSKKSESSHKKHK
jgi:hypothetical protein